MNKKMNRKVNNILYGMLFILCSSQSVNGYAQKITSIKDTVFVFLLKGTLENKQPIASYIVVKNLSSLETLAQIVNLDSFMCYLFKNVVLFEEPAFTLSRNVLLYNFQNEKDKTVFLGNLSKKIDNLNKGYISIKTKKFSNGKAIELNGVKVIGEFWVIPKNVDELNTYNHSFIVEQGCYTKGDIYNLKDLTKSCKMKKKEVEIIEKIVCTAMSTGIYPTSIQKSAR
jgi:hypothetical protein